MTSGSPPDTFATRPPSSGDDQDVLGDFLGDAMLTRKDRDQPRQDGKNPDQKGLIQGQHEIKERLRHVQEFLSSPAFLDLRDQPVPVADDDAALANRRRDLDYRITVMTSLLTVLTEERRMLDRVMNSPAPQGEAPKSVTEPDPDSDQGPKI